VLDKSDTLTLDDVAHHVHAHANMEALRRTGPHVLCGGDGVWVRDHNGRSYIDALSGMWCVGLGYNDAGLIEAARKQLSTLSYCPIFGERTSDTAIRLATSLTEMAPRGLSHAFFVNSGSEANDTALKLVWYVNNTRGKPGKKKVITFDRAYHGATVGAASLTALPHMHRAFDLPLFPVVRVPAPDVRRLRRDEETVAQLVDRLIGDIEQIILREGPETIGAFFAEPVLGAGGVIVPPPDYFPRLQALLRKHDILFVADEIITGFGRTGEMFGSEAVGIDPDMITLAKNLSSGYVPIGAVLMKRAIYETIVLASGTIGTFACGMTYSGHPVSCAVALACLDRYAAPEFLPRVRALGAHLSERLRPFVDSASVADVRSIGLLAAVELVPAKDGEAPSVGAAGKRLVAAALDRGVILRALGDTVVFCPPFVSTERDLDVMVDRFALALGEVELEVPTN
jgi:4-aminobutyrate---pyruvate transaminase